MLKHKHGLKYYIWLYFVLFLLTNFALLWLFQIIFLESFYENRKIQEIEEIIQTVSDTYVEDDEAAYDALRNIAISNNICMTIVNTSGEKAVDIDIQDKRCMLHSDTVKIDEYIRNVNNSENGIYKFKAEFQKTETDYMLYGTACPDVTSDAAYIFISIPLKPISSTIDIIKLQMLYIIVILFLISIIISYFTANSIAEPIVNITQSSENLAKGNYKAKFDGGDYLEVQKLADALNYAATEISHTDTLQRDLIANVSHDLRTPLTMVKAYAEMIRDLSGDNPEKRNEHLNIIIEETDRLAMLVNDMLDLSKLESGGMVMKYSNFGITQLLYDIAERYDDFCKKNGYFFEFIPDEEVMVHCDEGKIQQVVYNLLNNAINYTDKVERRIIMRQKNSFNFVKIEISDSGDGIDENNLHLVFDKYYRTEKSKREVVGTGLGLSIVQAILKKHNYPYGVESHIGSGSTFWFKIII